MRSPTTPGLKDAIDSSTPAQLWLIHTEGYHFHFVYLISSVDEEDAKSKLDLCEDERIIEIVPAVDTPRCVFSIEKEK